MTKASEEDEIVAGIADVARRHLEWTGTLSRDLPLVETMKLDSLRLLTLVIEIENKFRIRLEPEDEETIHTVGDLIDTIRSKRVART